MTSNASKTITDVLKNKETVKNGFLVYFNQQQKPSDQISNRLRKFTERIIDIAYNRFLREMLSSPYTIRHLIY